MNYLIPQEAAALAGVSRITILKWIRKHGIADGKDDKGRWRIHPMRLGAIVHARQTINFRQRGE